jgi:hypothetical protein
MFHVEHFFSAPRGFCYIPAPTELFHVEQFTADALSRKRRNVPRGTFQTGGGDLVWRRFGHFEHQHAAGGQCYA